MKQKLLRAIRVFKDKTGNKLPLVILGIFIMIYAGIFMAYSQHQSDADDLESEIATKEAILKNPGPNLDQLNEELRQVQEALANASKVTETPEEVDLPDSTQALELYESLVDLAEDDYVELSSIAGGQPGGGSIPALSTMTYTLSVQGEYRDLLGFVSDLTRDPDLLKGVEFGSIDVQNSGTDGSASSLSLQLSINVLTESLSLGGINQ